MTVDQVPDFASLPEAEQRAIAERLLRIKESGWKPFYCPDPECGGDPHPLLTEDGAKIYVPDSAEAGPNGEPISEDVDYAGDTRLGRYLLDPRWAHNHARKDQRLLPWREPWTLFVMSGRGSGKTRMGVEFVTLSARRGLDGAILGRRSTELVNTHVAEILHHAHPEFTPTHYPSKDLLVWPNGAKTYLFSAEKPENIRSVNLSYAWVDEAAFMDDIETAWMNLRLATRVKKPGNPIHFLITSTPQGTPWVIKMEDDPEVVVRRVSTFANARNLDPDFLEALKREYQGTRMGRQELEGEVLRDVEGALWNDGMYQHLRLDAEGFAQYLENLDDRVVAIDPAGSKGKRSDATGIVAVGAMHTDDEGGPLSVSQFAVLADGTLKGTPTEWARQAFKVARHVRAHRIVAEKNYGGDMVKQVLEDFAEKFPAEACDENGEDFRIVVVHAERSKETRAEGVVGRYEQGRVTHVLSPGAFGDLSMLEKEQTTWVPKSRGGKMPSPNRVDACVWGLREVDTARRFRATTATADVIRHLRRPAGRLVGTGI